MRAPASTNDLKLYAIFDALVADPPLRPSHVVDAVARLDRRDDAGIAEPGLVGIANDLCVLDPRRADRVRRGPLQPFECIEDDGIGAVANGVHDDLEARGIGREDASCSVPRRVQQETRCRRIVGVRLEERRRSRAHRPVRKELDARQYEPSRPRSRLLRPQRSRPSIPMVLNRVDACGQLAASTQGLIGLKLHGAGRHVLQRRDTKGAGMAQRRARLVRSSARAYRRGTARMIRSIALSLKMPGGLARLISNDRAALRRPRAARPMPASRIASVFASPMCPSSR